MLQDARLEQKRLDLLRLLSQDLLGQIVQDVALISTDLLQQTQRITTIWQGKTEQLQTHQPALHPTRYLLDHLIWQVHAHHLIKESPSLLYRTAQLVCAHF